MMTASAWTVVLISLWVGPAFAAAARRGAEISVRTGRWVRWTVAALCVFALLPHAVSHGGWPALPAFAVGVALPSLLEAIAALGRRGSHAVATLVVIAGLCGHALLDGAAVSLAAANAQSLLVWVIALHRLPTGLAVWLAASPIWGVPLTVGALIAMTVTTIAGAFVGDWAAPWIEASWIAWFEAAIAGMLLHTLGHTPATVAPSPSSSPVAADPER